MEFRSAPRTAPTPCHAAPNGNISQPALPLPPSPPALFPDRSAVGARLSWDCLSLLHVVSAGLYWDWRIQCSLTSHAWSLGAGFPLGCRSAPPHGLSRIVSSPPGPLSPHGLLLLAVEPGLLFFFFTCQLTVPRRHKWKLPSLF